MDIESAIRQTLEKSHTLENFQEYLTGFSFTIKNSQQEELKIRTMQFQTVEGTWDEFCYFRFKDWKNFDDFSNAFNVNIFDTLYEDIELIKNEFNFLNSYFFGKELEFEDLSELLRCGILRSKISGNDFFALSINIHFYPHNLKFLLQTDYSYFDKFDGGVFEDNLHDFRLSFLKKYVVPLLDKPLEELRLEDHKILHMVNI
jgi:hypothetical protein